MEADGKKASLYWNSSVFVKCSIPLELTCVTKSFLDPCGCERLWNLCRRSGTVEAVQSRFSFGVQILAPPRGSSWWSVQRYHKFLRLKSPKDAETVNILEKKSLLTLLWIYKGLNIVWFTTPSLTSKAEGRKNLQVSSIYPPQKNSGRP